MAPAHTSHLLSPSELSYIQTSLSLHPPIRPDARLPTSFRPLTAETNLLPSTNGSARMCFADGTEAIVGVKAEVEKTAGVRGAHRGDDNGERADFMEGEGEEGRSKGRGRDEWVEVSVDMPGYQRDDDPVVVFLSSLIHEALVADGALREKLVINRGWHWRLYIDILLVSPPNTYPLPLLSLTTHLALLDTRLPAPVSSEDEDPMFNDDWDASIPLYSKPSGERPPVTLLVVVVGENIFFDPSGEEVAVSEACVAISVSSPHVSSTSPFSTSEIAIKVLAMRTIDPPSRISATAAGASATEAGEGEGVWQPKRGGLGRKVIARIIRQVTEKGGVGEEVVRGMEGFVG